jgi:hypothetical protein
MYDSGWHDPVATAVRQSLLRSESGAIDLSSDTISISLQPAVEIPSKAMPVETNTARASTTGTEIRAMILLGEHQRLLGMPLIKDHRKLCTTITKEARTLTISLPGRRCSPCSLLATQNHR